MAVNRIPYSSSVKLKLSIDGNDLELAQVGPDFVILRTPLADAQLTTSARLDVIVDQHVATSKRVFLPHGIAAGTLRVSYF